MIKHRESHLKVVILKAAGIAHFSILASLAHLRFFIFESRNLAAICSRHLYMFSAPIAFLALFFVLSLSCSYVCCFHSLLTLVINSNYVNLQNCSSLLRAAFAVGHTGLFTHVLYCTIVLLFNSNRLYARSCLFITAYANRASGSIFAIFKSYAEQMDKRHALTSVVLVMVY